MDALLANQSGTIPIASAPPRALNRGSLASPLKRQAANSYLSSRKGSWRVAPRSTNTGIGVPNTNSRKTLPGAQIMTEKTAACSLIKTWSLFTACAAGEGFLLYAILVAHTLRPVTAILIGHDSGRPGASARYQQVFNWDGLIPTMLGSLFVVAAVWCALQLTARNLPMASLDQLQMAPAEDPTASGVINLSARAD
jgi:hypothetical protein